MHQPRCRVRRWPSTTMLSLLVVSRTPPVACVVEVTRVVCHTMSQLPKRKRDALRRTPELVPAPTPQCGASPTNYGFASQGQRRDSYKRYIYKDASLALIFVHMRFYY
jgi:hypothetical protein